MGIIDWKPDKAEFGKRVNNSALFNWEGLDLDTYRITKPTVLCFSGNATITNKDANALCRLVEDSLELLKSDDVDDIKDVLDIVGFKYAKHGTTASGGLTREFVNKFVDEVLVSLFKDENGQRLDLNSALKNMSKLSFFSYCAGSLEVSSIMKDLNSRLERLGYSPSEINLIDNAGKHVSFAPFDNIQNYLPTVRVISVRDGTVGQDVWGVLNKNGMKDLDGIALTKDEPEHFYGRVNMKAKCGGINIISSKFLNAIENHTNEHYINILDRDKNWDLKPTLFNEENVISHNADCSSQMMSWALCRAVDNSFNNEQSDVYVPNNFMTGLYSELESIKDSFGNDKLGISEELKESARRSQYKNNSRMILTKVNRANLEKTFCEPKGDMYAQLIKAKDLEDVAFIFEKNNYYYIEEFLPKLSWLSDDEIFALHKATTRCKTLRDSHKWGKNQMGLLGEMASAKTLDEIFDLAQFIDHGIVKESLLWVVDNVINVKEFTYEKALELMNSLKKQWKFEEEEKKQPYFQYMTDKMHEIDMQGGDKFSKTIELLERKNYFAVPDIIGGCNYLDEKQINIVKSMFKARQRAIQFERERIDIADFDKLKDEVSNASSIEEIISIFAKNNYYGVKYILPEIVVLTEEEKKEILKRCEDLYDEIANAK